MKTATNPKACARMRPPRTRFVNNRNPFTGEDMTVKKKPAAFVNVANLSISDDPLPEYRSAPGHKYDEVFDKLKPGKCLVCEPGEAGKIGHALNTYLKRKAQARRARDQIIVDRLTKGDRATDVGRDFGISVGMVCVIRDRAGLPKKRAPRGRRNWLGL